MTSPPSPPTKRRRRWLIVAFLLVLVLVSMVSWWNWPRGDARFVGKWVLSQWAYESGPLLRLDLRSNGAVVVVHGKTRSAKNTMYGSWVVSENCLLVGNPLKRPVNRAVSVIADALETYASINLMTESGWKFYVESVTDTEVILRTSPNNTLSGIRARRITE